MCAGVGKELCMYVCTMYLVLVSPPYDHIEGPGGRVREHDDYDDVDHGDEVELLVGPGLVQPTPVAGFL